MRPFAQTHSSHKLYKCVWAGTGMIGVVMRDKSFEFSCIINCLLFCSYQSPSSNPSTRQLSSTDERSSAINRQHTSSSLVDPTSSPGSISMDPTPIPSPQPSFTSSLRSARSSGRGSGRKRQRNHSPGHMSSGSEDTIKVEYRSVALHWNCDCAFSFVGSKSRWLYISCMPMKIVSC